MKDRMNIKEWVDHFHNGDWDTKDIDTQITAGWYDWFCKDSSLRNKTLKMGRIIAGISDGGKVDRSTMYVWFKNNCPHNGPLYDEYRNADLETGNVMFTIQIDCCWNKSKYAVYGRTPDGEFHSDSPLFECNDARELERWLSSPWEPEQLLKEIAK